jgi:hypothetical protein
MGANERTASKTVTSRACIAIMSERSADRPGLSAFLAGAFHFGGA